MTAPCRPLDLVCAFGESPCRPGLLDVVFMRCKNRTGQNRTKQHNQHNQQKISPPLGTFSRKTRRSPHACTRTCEQRGANERWEGICLVLGSSCAPHPLTQHSHGTKRAALARPYANRKQVLQSLSVKRVRMRDVCAGPPGLLVRVGLGSTCVPCPMHAPWPALKRAHELCSPAVESARLARDLLESIEATPSPSKCRHPCSPELNGNNLRTLAL
jgi:hypothetical protein